MITHAQISFIETRHMIQEQAAEVGARVSNTRSKIMAQAVINELDRTQYQREANYNEDNYKSFTYGDPVGEKVIRRVMAILAGHTPEPIN